MYWMCKRFTEGYMYIKFMDEQICINKKPAKKIVFVQSARSLLHGNYFDWKFHRREKKMSEWI